MTVIARPVTDEEKDVMKRGFEAMNKEAGAPPHATESFSFVAEEHGILQGAVYGYIRWDWVYIDILYVAANARGGNIGTTLMNTVEIMAKERLMTGLHLTTQDWQAGGFYEKCGYTQYAALNDFPKGHKRLSYCKYL